MKRKSLYVCKKTKERKVITTISIKEDIYKQVSKLAHEVYGFERGAFSYAVEEALQYWLETHTAAHMKTNPPPTIRERYNAVMRELRKMKGFIPVKTSKIDFEKAIMSAFNVADPRTIRKWLHTFFKMGFIKPLGIKVLSEKSWKNVLAVEIVAKET